MKFNNYNSIILRKGAVLVVFVLALIWAPAVEAKKLKAKEYKQDFTVSAGETLSGKGQGKTVIEGTIKMKNGSKLRNLTVKKGRIVVASGANVLIENVTITRASTKNAIVTTGGGTLTVRNSKITKSGKGMYIQRGKNIVITGNVITGNREEAIDIRSNVSGIISGNVITGNGESAIEVILGKSTLKITNNKLIGNGSSGIAAQFYSLAQSTGAIVVSGNTISRNRNYGIDCKLPSGGSPSANYWRKSIRMERVNTVSANSRGALAPRCGNLYYQVAVEEAAERARKFAQTRKEATPELEELQARQNTQLTELKDTAMQFAIQRSIWWRKIIGVDESITQNTTEIAQNLTNLEKDLDAWETKYQKLLKNDRHKETIKLRKSAGLLNESILFNRSNIDNLQSELLSWQGIAL